jgi:hypothetical protein
MMTRNGLWNERSIVAALVLFAALGCDDGGGPVSGMMGDDGGGTTGTDGGGTTGTDSGLPPGTDSGQPPGVDAGGPPGTDAGTTPAPEVPITVADSCPSAAPCGGDPTGSWHYTSGCVAGVFDALDDQCPSATVSDVVATVRGIVTVSATHLERDTTAHVAATAHIPAACSFGECAAIQAALAAGFDSAACTPASGGCDCDLEVTDRTMDADTYTIAGTTLVTGDGDRYEYCVDGGTLRYRPLDSGREESYELARR